MKLTLDTIRDTLKVIDMHGLSKLHNNIVFCNRKIQNVAAFLCIDTCHNF